MYGEYKIIQIKESRGAGGGGGGGGGGPLGMGVFGCRAFRSRCRVLEVLGASEFRFPDFRWFRCEISLFNVPAS